MAGTAIMQNDSPKWQSGMIKKLIRLASVRSFLAWRNMHARIRVVYIYIYVCKEIFMVYGIIVQRLFEMRNYYSCVAVLAGVDCIPVRRLKKTRAVR